MTSVGKIFKPELRCDATARMVKQLLIEKFQLSDALVQVSTGGPRGMRVSVSVPQTSRSVLPAVKQALDAYLFESQLQVQVD